MMTRLEWLVALALMAGTSTLTAQQHQHQGGGQQPAGMVCMHMGRMSADTGAMGPAMHMHMMAIAPAQLLEKKDELKLTPAQVSQIEKIQTDASTQHEQAMASHDKHMQEMMDAMHAAKPDPQVVRAHFQGMHESMGVAAWAGIEAGLASLAVLTDEQRVTVKAWMDQGMSRGMGRGMGMGMGQGMGSGECMPGCCQSAADSTKRPGGDR